MGATITVFESALSALTANAGGMSVTANNIANVNTPGYARQRVTFASRSPQVSGGIELGRGVELTSVERIFDEFAELRLTNASSDKGETDVGSGNIRQVEALFNEVGQPGLAQYIGDFFNTWSDIANDASERAPRNNTLNKAAILIDRFHQLSQGLKDNRTLLDGDVRDRVSQINNMAEQLADINQRIAAADERTQLTLRDQRTQLVHDLAEYVDVQALETSDGEYQVYIAQGLQLVAGATYGTLSTQVDATNAGLVDVLFAVGSATGSDITSRINGGELKGLLDLRDTTIPSYQTQLDELAYELATEFNTVHLTGFGLDGVGARRFFGDLATTVDAAASIALDAAVDGVPNALAAAGAAAQIPAGNSVSLTLAAMQTTSITFTTGSTTFTNFYSGLLATIGSDTSFLKDRAGFAAEVFRQAQVQRERVSGVSLEEEQMLLLKYQSAFQAASRMVGVADQLLQTLVQLLE
ncbi:MAG: flagellar hook-associated protein FlgK [Deltaproteobacteria bacterium]|nr:flagellar hook-associated protein FlgK [Deltaproteobacteria bacterium]